MSAWERHGLVLRREGTAGAWSCATDGGEILVPAGGAGLSVEIAGWRLGVNEFQRWETAETPDSVRVQRFYLLRYEPSEEVQPAAAGSLVCLGVETLRLERPGRLSRELHVEISAEPRAPTGRHQLISTTLWLEGLTIGSTDADALTVSVPMGRLRPGPLPETGPGGAPLEASGLDIGLAAVTLARMGQPFGRLTVVPNPTECPVKLRLSRREGGIRVEHEFGGEAWLEPGVTLTGGGQVIEFHRTADWRDPVSAIGRALRGDRGYAPPADRPAWAREAVIQETDLAACGGLRGLREELAELNGLGVNTLYLMPFHTGTFSGYGTSDYEAIDPTKGTAEELRALTDAAHGRGMRVLFDLLMNIAGDESDYPRQHPDWFYREADGSVRRHPVWGGWCLDPASPGFRRYLCDYAQRCVGEWGANGFRVDAVAYRGGNWQSAPGLRPHQHSHAVFSLIGEVRDAIRAVNPDAILLAECFGPQQVPISDLVGFQWIGWLDWALSRALSGELDGAAFTRLLGEHFLALPPDTWLAGYTHTHDTVAFEKRELDGPAVDALFATLSLLTAARCSFGGGWGMRVRPGNPREASDLRTLCFAKKMLGGVATHEVHFQTAPDAALLVAERPSRRGPALVVANFSDRWVMAPEQVANLSPFYSRLGHAASFRGRIEPGKICVPPAVTPVTLKVVQSWVDGAVPRATPLESELCRGSIIVTALGSSSN